MNAVWLWLSGIYRLRLTGAEPERTIRGLAQLIRLGNVERESDLCMVLEISRFDYGTLIAQTQRAGDRIEILEERGLPVRLRAWKRYPILTGTMVVLALLSILLPGRILFLKVEGNERVPESLILERASECGLSFWADRGSMRSEQIKNRLLSLIPELSWVGVNTRGSCAVISVQERRQEQSPEPEFPGNIVAVTDALVTDITASSGTALCTPGDAVKAGQILISGYTNLGLCTHVERAQGEVYGMTQRKTRAVIPVRTWLREPEKTQIKKYSMIFGKKRINFYSDSGILHIGCGKMTQIRYLCLPGGLQLPVALVIERYDAADCMESERRDTAANELLLARSLSQLKGQMRSGEILSMESSFDNTDTVFTLILNCYCREMIGRHSDGIITEGDMQNDRENGERGAG